MNRLLTFWQHYMQVPPEASTFMSKHCQVRHYARNSVFSYPDEPLPYWCFIVEGLAAGIYFHQGDRQTIRWLAAPYSYFTGTEHTFTKRQSPVTIEFWAPSTIVLMPNQQAIWAQQHHPSISELFHILKQHQLNRLRKYVQLFQHKNEYARFKMLMKELPEIVALTTTSQQAEILQISRTWYHRLKRRYLTER